MMGGKSTIVAQETLDVIVIIVHGNIAVHKKNMRFLYVPHQLSTVCMWTQNSIHELVWVCSWVCSPSHS